jgi:predicted outer membrane repeat protein
MLTFVASASATDWHYPGDGATLQAVEDRAADNDTIYVAAGVFTEALSVDRDVTFALDPATTLEAGHPDDGVFKVVSGATVTVTAGTLDGGGSSRIATVGDSCGLTLLGVTVVDTHHDADGGAVWVHGSATALRLERSTFTTSTTGGKGGFVYSDGNAQLVIVGPSSFVGGVATGDGGAIYANSADVLTIEGAEFRDDTAANGGALYLHQVPTGARISDSTFVHNGATIEGGCPVPALPGLVDRGPLAVLRQWRGPRRGHLPARPRPRGAGERLPRPRPHDGTRRGRVRGRPQQHRRPARPRHHPALERGPRGGRLLRQGRRPRDRRLPRPGARRVEPRRQRLRRRDEHRGDQRVHRQRDPAPEPGDGGGPAHQPVRPRHPGRHPGPGPV